MSNTDSKEYTAATKRKATCPVCTANALAKSHLLLSVETGKLYNAYQQMYANEDIAAAMNEENRAVHILTGKINSSVLYLDQYLFTQQPEYEAYVSMARNLIEKIALLSFILEKESRAKSLGKIFDISSFDIFALFSKEREDASRLIEEWKSHNNWTKSEVSHRLEQLGDEEIQLVYAYSSRLIHGLNRDEMLGDISDMLYTMAYIYIVTLKTYHKAMGKVPHGMYAKSTQSAHQAIVKELELIWAKSGTPIHSVLELTLYGLEFMPYSDNQKSFIAKHNEGIDTFIKEKAFASYVDPEGQHYHDGM